MRKLVMGALLVAGALALARRAGVSADVTADSTEVRVFVLDKSGMPVDIRNWTGAVDIMPVRGQRRAFKLETVSSKTEGMKEGAKEGAPKEQYSAKEPIICGQVKELDDWYVEMTVGRAGPAYHKGGEGTPGAKEDESKGFTHTHGGNYFKAAVEDMAIKDAKTGIINFKATVVFTLPSGETKYVKGYSFPEGAIEDSLGRILDKDLKDTSKFDHEQAAMNARKIQTALRSLPPLAFKDAGDRQEFEKAKQECLAASHRLEQATGKDIADAADKVKAALKDVRSQAKDAEGALPAQ
jgi:hypothetical protein